MDSPLVDLPIRSGECSRETNGVENRKTWKTRDDAKSKNKVVESLDALRTSSIIVVMSIRHLVYTYQFVWKLSTDKNKATRKAAASFSASMRLKGSRCEGISMVL